MHILLYETDKPFQDEKIMYNKKLIDEKYTVQPTNELTDMSLIRQGWVFLHTVTMFKFGMWWTSGASFIGQAVSVE